jgi:hypothetical protein
VPISKTTNLRPTLSASIVISPSNSLIPPSVLGTAHCSWSSAMVCIYCKEKVFEANTPWGFHHQHRILKESATNGCFVCVQLDKDIREAKLKLSPDSVTHRWTIRMKTQTRERHSGFITVTLRPTIPSSDQPALPERIFYLIAEKGLKLIQGCFGL